MRCVDNKLYVNVKTGVVYHMPVKVNGLNYEPPKDLYEITADQAARIDKGEPLRSVLREGIRAKVESELADTMKDEAPAAEAPPAAPAALDLDAADETEVESFTTHKDIDAYAASKGLEIPAECTTMQLKKDFINTALLAG